MKRFADDSCFLPSSIFLSTVFSAFAVSRCLFDLPLNLRCRGISFRFVCFLVAMFLLSSSTSFPDPLPLFRGSWRVDDTKMKLQSQRLVGPVIRGNHLSIYPLLCVPHVLMVSTTSLWKLDAESLMLEMFSASLFPTCLIWLLMNPLKTIFWNICHSVC